MKRTETGAGFFYPVLRFRRRNGTAKIQTVKGLRVEIFSRPLRKNTTRPLTVWIGGTDGEMHIVFMERLCYNKVKFLYVFGG